MLLADVDHDTLRGKRDAVILSLLLGCGLRRSEVIALKAEDVQRRDERWAITDLVGRAGHVRTVPVPGWVKIAIDAWTEAAGVVNGRLFRSIRRAVSSGEVASLRMSSGTS